MVKKYIILFKLALLTVALAGLSGCFDWSDMWDDTSAKEDTTSATNMTCCSAMLHGTVNPGNQYSTLAFEYGTSRSFGQTINVSQVDILDKKTISTTVTGLTPLTLYYYRLIWIIDGTVITSYGSTVDFTTLK
jgi:hypothetical protein